MIIWCDEVCIVLQHFHEAAYQAKTQQELVMALNCFLDYSVVLPPSEVSGEDLLRSAPNLQQEKLHARDGSLVPRRPGDEPLRRSGRLFGGLIKDVTRRYPQYLSDLRDALNPQCMAAIIFIYFAALSPAITFGGLLGECWILTDFNTRLHLNLFSS